MTVRRAILVSLISITMLAFVIQIFIDPSLVNTATACIVMASSLSVLLYIHWTTAIETHPLSTFALFGFCVTSQLGALLAQTAFLTAVSASLYDPLYTFGTLAFYQSIALAVHAVYRFFSLRRAGGTHVLRGLFDRLAIYQVPPVATLWLMGLVGLATFFFAHFEGVLGKLANGFSFLTFSPFLILFYLRELGDSYCDARFNKGLLAAFTGAAGLLGLALNTRMVMFTGGVTVALLYLLWGMRSDGRVTARAILRLGALVIVLAAVAIPLSDLATSMAIARQWRGKVSASEMIQTTFHIMGRPELIAAYRARGKEASRYRIYDEFYVENPLLNRLVTTKYTDNSLHFASALTAEDAKSRLRETSMNLVWAGLPTPLLNALDIPASKGDFSYSIGDALAYLSRGIPLGGHLIGSMIAQGIALFGPVFPFMYAGICLLLFTMMDLLTLRSAKGRAAISTLGMLQIWSFFNGGIAYEGLHLVLIWLFRNFGQTILIYFLVFVLARAVTAKRPGSSHVLKLSAWQRG